METRISDFFIKITYLGYKTLIINNIEINAQIIDLKTIPVTPDQDLLDEVVITGEKSQTVFKLDKRVFNVGKDLSSAGGSALDVLNNVPSVDVNIEGAISLRGNTNVQVLINGKPSVLTSGSSNKLGTITAEMIEKVEVVTNPSAKYDAEGTTGIINIVLKKEERKGVNGAISLNMGNPASNNVGISLNRRTEKFNLFTQIGAGKTSFLSTYNGLTIDRSDTNPQQFFNNGDGEKNEGFYSIILGADYYFNAKNVLTISGQFGNEFEDENALTQYNIYNASKELINTTDRSRSQRIFFW
jgi:hypothetical protein